MSTKLTQDAVRTVFQHERSLLLRIVPIYVLGVGIVILWFSAFGFEFGVFESSDDLLFEAITGRQGVVLLLGLILYLVIYSILVIMWHRAVLKPHALMPAPMLIARYVWASLKLVLLVVLLLFIPIILISILAAAIQGAYIEWVIVIVTSFLPQWLVLRFGLVLPHAALGLSGMGLGASWRRTQSRNDECIVGALAVLVLTTFVNLLLGALVSDESLPIFAIALDAVLSPIPILFGLSLLTVLYRDDAASHV